MDPTKGAVQSNRSGIHDLPNDIVEQFMYCLDSVLSLHALMTVYPQARQIYQEGAEAIFFAIIRNSTIALGSRESFLRHSASADSGPIPRSITNGLWLFSGPISTTTQPNLFLIHVHVYSIKDLWQ